MKEPKHGIIFRNKSRIMKCF